MELSPEKKQRIQDYYLQDAVVEEMVRVAEYREVAPTYPRGYGRRPDAVNFPGDFKALVEKGAVAFHGSVEIWRNPLLIGEQDADELRTGWDLVMDIDCDEDLEFAKAAAMELVNELERHGVSHTSVKFSGNRGFHVGVRREAFPDTVQGQPTTKWYPELPRRIVDYLRAQLKERLAERFVKLDSTVRETVYDDGEPVPYRLCDIENDWGDRHLFRMPYSINEKSWCISLPLARDAVEAFTMEDARVEERMGEPVEERFLDTFEEGEAKRLVVEALDWYAQEHAQQDEDDAPRDYDVDIPDEAIDEEHFPPTIHNILSGLEDGRKRAVFVLATFLRHVGYPWPAVEQALMEWNQRNAEPLDETYIRTQLNWHKRQDEPLMPPNFDARGYYKDMQVYEEDALTEAVNNPVTYALVKARDEDEDGDGEAGGVEEGKETVYCPYCNKPYEGETKWYRDHVMQCQG